MREPGRPVPSLNSLYFYLTEGCNLRCRHCWISPEFQTGAQDRPVLNPELFESIVEQARPLGLAGMKLTGGEPLLHPNIIEILEYVRRTGLSLTIETNGILCTPRIAGAIAACPNPFVSVSLDGSEPEVHEWIRGVPGSFQAALVGVRNLVQAGVRPQLIMTVMRRNKHQLRSVVELAGELGAGSVKFNLMQPTARGERMHETGEDVAIEELIDLGRWVEQELAPQTGIRLFYDQPAAFRSFSAVYGERGSGRSRCGILGILGVLADGSYALCGIGATVPDLVFGKAGRDRLIDVWERSPVLQEIRAGLPARLEGICGECLMSKACLGSCLAQNYYRGGNLWAPFWFCSAAEDQGLFPESRRRLPRARPTN